MAVGWMVVPLMMAASGEMGSMPEGQVEQLGPGLWRIRFGEPERFVPTHFRERPPALEALNGLPKPGELPFALSDIRCQVRSSRTVVHVPCDEPNDEIYGFGLDPRAYRQKGLKKWLTVCASVMDRTGASHGPVPFYVSTRGYGVYVDTARVPHVHVARLVPKATPVEKDSGDDAAATSEAELYQAQRSSAAREVVFDLPGNSTGVDVYVFGGPTLREAVQRYNLFSGGGCVPPMWGLGMKYRTYVRADRATVLDVAESIRKFGIPCDMLGLEPGWQTHAYSSSLVWSDERFPNHQEFLDRLTSMGFKPNLWEHAYIHPSSPLHTPLLDHSGDYLVWGGLVVDFADPEAYGQFADYHEEAFFNEGVLGFKADECDRQQVTDCTPFNYPYCSTFPSGIDGDQMTQLYGYLYQRSILSVFKRRNQRTWGDVRATTALSGPLPFNLYSDAYSFEEYLRQLVNASFAGLLWSPEVRQAGSLEELLNRIAMSSFAPQMSLNPWPIPHTLWEQYEREKNENHELLPPDEQERVANRIRAIGERRMSLLPYLYSCFHRYRETGLPPVRSLLMDFPEDGQLRDLDNEFLFGDSLLVAPFLGTAMKREVYLPSGTDWVELATNLLFRGGARYQVEGQAGEVPVFVRMNALLPIAKPVPFVADDTVFEITVKVFGEAPGDFVLYEDDGQTYDFESGALNRVRLHWEGGNGSVERSGEFRGERYRITGWEFVALEPPAAS